MAKKKPVKSIEELTANYHKIAGKSKPVTKDEFEKALKKAVKPSVKPPRT